MVSKFDANSFELDKEDFVPMMLEHECGQRIALEAPYTLASALATANIHKCPDYSKKGLYGEYYWETGKPK